MKLKLSVVFVLWIVVSNSVSAQSTISQVTGFGTNPGNLKMYTYIPSGVVGSGPLVVAMHGCGQTALDYATQSGWNKLANLHKFYVVYPQQSILNNSTRSVLTGLIQPIKTEMKGEALSIKQMVDYMSAHYSISASQIFVTGLSAGAGMTSVMMATYPEIFNKGAIMSLPYKAATTSLEAVSAMYGFVTKTPTQWGNLVRSQNPSYTGAFPHLAVFQGTADFTVNNANATELIKQWTNLNNADQTADATNSSFDGNAFVEQTIYNDNLNNPVVYYYKITGMGHGIALDTGACPRKGGQTATYALEYYFHSTYWAADFFNLITNPYAITGSINVSPSAAGIVYSVPFNTGSSYAWTVPTGATIVSGQGSNSITVNFATGSGYVRVTETTSGGCENDEAKLYVNVSVASGIANEASTKGNLYYNREENSIVTNNIDLNELKSVEIYNSIGQKVNEDYFKEGNTIRFYSDLKPGIYIVSIYTKQKLSTAKIVVLQ